MGDYKHKPNRGSLLPNDYKEAGDNRPDSKGKGLCECPFCHKTWKVDIAGWREMTQDGTPRLSLSFTPVTYKPDERADTKGGTAEEERGAGDDDIPF